MGSGERPCAGRLWRSAAGALACCCVGALTRHAPTPPTTPWQVRVWDIGGLRKKTVAPGGGAAVDDMLRLPQVGGSCGLRGGLWWFCRLVAGGRGAARLAAGCACCSRWLHLPTCKPQ